jgi:hypothetical protein
MERRDPARASCLPSGTAAGTSSETDSTKTLPRGTTSREEETNTCAPIMERENPTSPRCAHRGRNDSTDRGTCLRREPLRPGPPSWPFLGGRSGDSRRRQRFQLRAGDVKATSVPATTHVARGSRSAVFSQAFERQRSRRGHGASGAAVVACGVHLATGGAGHQMWWEARVMPSFFIRFRRVLG